MPTWDAGEWTLRPAQGQRGAREKEDREIFLEPMEALGKEGFRRR